MVESEPVTPALAVAQARDGRLQVVVAARGDFLQLAVHLLDHSATGLYRKWKEIGSTRNNEQHERTV